MQLSVNPVRLRADERLVNSLSGRDLPEARDQRTDVLRWKKRNGGLMPSEVTQDAAARGRNGRLKRIVADLSLDKEMLPGGDPKRHFREHFRLTLRKANAALIRLT